MLEIKNLHANIEQTEILKGLNLKIGSGEVHALMGLNGSGKSTLANILTGRDKYQVTSGEILFYGKDLLTLTPEARAGEGIFLAFQYSVELPGVNEVYFLRTACNEIRKYRGLAPYSITEFAKIIKEKSAKLGLSELMLSRSVNSGFSGGEKKRNEVLMMEILEPKLCILDEIDSGLDIDALQVVAEGVNRLRNADRSFIVITHYQRLLNYIVPDFVHVIVEGQIVKSGGKELALELEEKGYSWLK
ncbi:MAG: Fe-S cluster assembly ATPase SufC [Deltaproteobacteria bacterium]|jgi:Fe-S cluster assembly ATP-binding protein|nr:Fe-S cluster assembly ATPase SufC [Deltaproteobacteria bacterium]